MAQITPIIQCLQRYTWADPLLGLVLLDLTKMAAKKLSESDEFVSVARRLGADESHERFETKLKKIAKAKPEK
jgi:hypothetical protein